MYPRLILKHLIYLIILTEFRRPFSCLIPCHLYFVWSPKGRFTRYDFVAYDKLTSGLRHELFRVNQSYNSLNGPKSCRRPVVSLSSVNKILKKFCRQNQWNFIEHNNLNLTHLNRGGLHLSKSGTALVAENFCKYID